MGVARVRRRRVLFGREGEIECVCNLALCQFRMHE